MTNDDLQNRAAELTKEIAELVSKGAFDKAQTLTTEWLQILEELKPKSDEEQEN